MQLTHEEAVKLKPPGWDVFKKTHLMYMDGVNRKAGVAELNYEAYKAFSDTVLMQRSNDLINEQKKVDEFLKSGKRLGVDEFPWPITQNLFGRFRNYEYLKIGCGFELSLKSQLLHCGYIIHEIDKSDDRYSSLATKQKKKPIKIDDLTTISDYMYDGTHNILPGITNNSLQFSKIIGKSEYKSAYSLDSKTLAIISAYKDLRNSIHLPGDPAEISVLTTMSWKHKIQFIRKYIEERIVNVNRDIVEKHELHRVLKIEEWETVLRGKSNKSINPTSGHGS